MVALALTSAAMQAEAQVAVSNGGMPSYSHAIGVPPGIAGMAPKLGLFYAGGGVNGPVGHGWSVQGLSSITRCPATVATDGAGNRAPVNFVASDKLCLDGQRLIQTNEAGTPVSFPQLNDAAGLSSGYREYRTEKDTYARIRAYGIASGSDVASGPAYFKVWTKAGQIVEYGATPAADANTKALITAQGKTVAMAWAVARIGDTLGNTIDFKYESREVPWGSGTTAGSPTPGREWNLAEIQYSGNKVIFNYADRPVTAPRDAAEAYHKGSKNVSLRLLQSISTYVNSPNTSVLGKGSAAQPVSTTLLTYGNGLVSKRSRVTKIQQCAGEASSTRCLPPTSFAYADGANEAYAADADFNLGTVPMHGGTYGVIPADFNGDGKTDLLRWSENPAENRMYLSQGDGSFQLASAFAVNDRNFFNASGCYLSMVADFNGDGLMDVLRYAGSANPNGTVCPTPVGTNHLYRSNGDGSFTRSDITGVVLSRSKSKLRYNCPGGADQCSEPGPGIGWSAGQTFYILDVDGDGKLDIITSLLPSKSVSTSPYGDPCAGATCTRLYAGDGAGNFSERSTNLASKYVYADPATGYVLGEPQHIADIDGDGIADLVAVGNPQVGTWARWRSRGDNNFDLVSSDRHCRQTLDFNGDGRADCLQPGIPASTNTLRVSDGSNALQPVANFDLTQTGNELSGVNAGMVVVDVNGDGRHDILRWHDDPTKNVVYLSNGDGTFVPSSSFNLSNATHQLRSTSNGSTDFVVGDFTGKGSAEVLRLKASPTAGAATANQLYAKSDVAPWDHLIRVTSATGSTTEIFYRPLSNAGAGSDSRYASDRSMPASPNPNAAVLPTIDLSVPMWVVTTTLSDSGVGTTKVTTEYSYAGLKADINGRGLLGFRNVRRQSPGANGDPLMVSTRYLQSHPYIGLSSQTESRLGTLTATNAPLLSATDNTYCDKTAATGSEFVATPTVPCPVPLSAKLQRPFLYKSVETGTDLVGASLPTVTTNNTFNDTGDPTTIVVTTNGSVAGVAQTFIQTTSNVYYSDDIAGDRWILGRLSRSSVTSKVPNSLSQVNTSEGTAPNASATVGTGPTQSGSLTAVSFGVRSVGTSHTLASTVSSAGPGPLSIAIPTGSSVSGLDFIFDSTNCPSSLAVGATCTISVRFSPSGVGSRSGTLTLSTGAGGLVTELTGSGTGSVAVVQSSASFGSHVYGSSIANQSVVVRNTGDLSMTLAVSGHSSPFALVSNGCSNVAPNVNCSITFSMASNAVGASSQNLTLSGATAGPVTATVSGTITGGTSVSRWGATSLSFGDVTVGQTSSQNVTLHNDGSGAPVDWSGALVNLPTGFSANTTGCSSVAPGSSCTVTITFAPGAAQGYGASSIYPANASSQSNLLSVSGTGFVAAPSISASPSPLAFGTRSKDSTHALLLTLMNSGNASATNLGFAFTYTSGTVNQGGYSIISGGTCASGGSLPAGGSCTLNVQFLSGCTSGSRNANLTISGSNFASVVTPVTGAVTSAGSCF